MIVCDAEGSGTSVATFDTKQWPHKTVNNDMYHVGLTLINPSVLDGYVTFHLRS